MAKSKVATLVAPSPTQLDSFPRRLHQLMVEQQLSQSDLARRVWGTRKDNRGYVVAKNRDRISAYLSGRASPEPRNLRKLAKALGVGPEDLAPDMTAESILNADPGVQMTALAGHEDKVYLRVNMLVPLAVASKVIALLAEIKDA